jgi:hypothetical protein
MKDRRKVQTAVNTLATEIKTLESIGSQALDHAARAKQILEAALPIAAQGLVDSIPIAAARGNSRPAEVLLREYQIDKADPGQRLLQSQFSAGHRDNTDQGGRVQVVIGLSLGGMQQAKEQRQLASSADVTTQVIEAQTVDKRDERPREPIK